MRGAKPVTVYFGKWEDKEEVLRWVIGVLRPCCPEIQKSLPGSIHDTSRNRIVDLIALLLPLCAFVGAKLSAFVMTRSE